LPVRDEAPVQLSAGAFTLGCILIGYNQ
jgi:hypothetical protein